MVSREDALDPRPRGEEGGGGGGSGPAGSREPAARRAPPPTEAGAAGRQPPRAPSPEPPAPSPSPSPSPAPDPSVQSGRAHRSAPAVAGSGRPMRDALQYFTVHRSFDVSASIQIPPSRVSDWSVLPVCTVTVALAWSGAQMAGVSCTVSVVPSP